MDSGMGWLGVRKAKGKQLLRRGIVSQDPAKRFFLIQQKPPVTHTEDQADLQAMADRYDRRGVLKAGDADVEGSTA
jgi:hypothetical protein